MRRGRVGEKDYLWTISEDAKEKLLLCLWTSPATIKEMKSNRLRVQEESDRKRFQLESMLKRINHLVNDFVAKNPKRGKTKELIKKTKEEIKMFKSEPFWDDPELNKSWIELHEERLLNIKPLTIARGENQEVIEWLKQKTFDVYDQNNLAFFKEERKARERVAYNVNKTAFITIINEHLAKSFYGYSFECEPQSWNTKEWPRAILEKYKDRSSYRDATAHTKKSFAPLKPTFF